ncbi:MAG: DUF3015 domain-containing protein [Desulfuromonadia bacterium]
MKKIVSLAVAGGVMIAASVASAAPYGTAGCGLGSLIFKDEPGAVQIFAATTNGTFGNQTFGITSGTLNCGSGIIKSSNDRATAFAAANLDNLSRDIAQGRGESLDAFAELLNVPADQRPTFAAKLQSNFDRIFPNGEVIATNVVETVQQIMTN